VQKAFGAILSELGPGLIDALFEVGKRRQEILSNLRSAFEEKDLERVLTYVEQLVGLDDKMRKESREKSH
jgi:hypothetical protein